jgi:hypothetical protein
LAATKICTRSGDAEGLRGKKLAPMKISKKTRRAVRIAVEDALMELDRLDQDHFLSESSAKKLDTVYGCLVKISEHLALKGGKCGEHKRP